MLSKPLFLLLAVFLFSAVFTSSSPLALAATTNYAGKILLINGNPSHLWYVSTITGKRYDLGVSGEQAVAALRGIALGISSANLQKIPVASSSMKGDVRLRQRLAGRFLLAVQNGGMLWYVNPKDQRRYYLTSNLNSFLFFQSLATNVPAAALQSIPIAFQYLTQNNPTIVSPEPVPPVQNIIPPLVQTVPPVQTTPPTEPTPPPTGTLFTLKDFTETPWNDAGTTSTLHFIPGQIIALSPSTSLRLETATTNGAAFTLWNKDANGCRLAYDTLYLKNSNDRERYAVALGWFLEFANADASHADITLSTGNQAFMMCDAHLDLKKHCLGFPHTGYSQIESGSFSRTYPTGAGTAYQTLALNNQLLSVDRIWSIFPSLKEATPLEGRWRFVMYETPQTSPEMAFMNFSVLGTTPGDVTDNIIHGNTPIETYADRIKKGDLSFPFLAEMHEWVHLLFYDTDLNHFSKSGGSGKLIEGVADYLSYKGLFAPGAEQTLAYSYCKDDHFEQPGSILNNMTYPDAFNAGWVYDAGNCFFKKVEDACGTADLNAVFGSLLSQAYSPFSVQPSLFRKIRDLCQNPDQLDRVMDAFGFSRDLYNQSYPLTSRDIIQQNGCLN